MKGITLGVLAMLFALGLPHEARGEAEGNPLLAFWVKKDPRELAPYEPTPMEVVERMLKLANIGSGDVVYDLGSGDGRIVIAAAKKYGVRAVGIELDPELVARSRDNVRQAGVEGLVEIREQDIMTADLSEATVVTMYLLADSNLRLRPILQRQLRPGARVVSNDFDMDDWEPDLSEAVTDAQGDEYTVFLWQIR